jgi:hypothetical protein
MWRKRSAVPLLALGSGCRRWSNGAEKAPHLAFLIPSPKSLTAGAERPTAKSPSSAARAVSDFGDGIRKGATNWTCWATAEERMKPGCFAPRVCDFCFRFSVKKDVSLSNGMSSTHGHKGQRDRRLERRPVLWADRPACEPVR